MADAENAKDNEKTNPPSAVEEGEELITDLPGPEEKSQGAIFVPEQAIGKPDVPYVSVPHREKTRRTLALILVWLLVTVVGVSLFAAVAGPMIPCFDKQLLLDLLNVIVPPTIALVGTVTGFYYGSTDK